MATARFYDMIYERLIYIFKRKEINPNNSYRYFRAMHLFDAEDVDYSYVKGCLKFIYNKLKITDELFTYSKFGIKISESNCRFHFYTTGKYINITNYDSQYPSISTDVEGDVKEAINLLVSSISKILSKYYRKYYTGEMYID